MMGWQKITSLPMDGKIVICDTDQSCCDCEIVDGDLLFDGSNMISRDLAMLMFTHWILSPEAD